MNRRKNDTQLYTFKVFADNLLTRKLNYPYFSISRIVWIWLIFGILPFALFAITSYLELWPSSPRNLVYLDNAKQ